MTSMRDNLVYMAGQILRNFASRGEDGAVAATAEHLALFWDPRMKAQAIAMLGDAGTQLSPEVRTVFELLRGQLESSQN